MSAPREVELESRPCPLGCAPADELVLVGRDRIHGLPGVFSVVRCRGCGLLRTDPRPSPRAMDAYYPEEYGPYRGTRVTPDAPPDARPAWRRAASTLLRRATDLHADRLPPLPPGRLLEIGCASGSFLHEMARRGWTVAGIEFSDGAAAAARALGYSVQTSTIEEAAAPSSSFDLVAGWMVLEHLHDPIRALRRLHGWTRRGGWAVFSVPNAASLGLSLFGSAWYDLHLPNHLYHFTPETLARVLDRGGWRLEQVFSHRDVKNVLASAGYALQDSERLPRFARWLAGAPERGGRAPLFLFPISLALAALRQTGRMTVWARRLDD